MKTKLFSLLLTLVMSNISIFSAHIWPIMMDDHTFGQYQPYIIHDFRSNGDDNNMNIWENTYIEQIVSDKNFYGNNGEYLSLKVSNLGWAGLGMCIRNANSVSAANSLIDSILANPSNYYLHLAIKSTDSRSHCFYFMGNEHTKFILGSTVIYDGAIYQNFQRDGNWHEFYIPMTLYANKISAQSIQTGCNIFAAMSEGVKGTRLDLDAVYFCDAEMIDVKPGIELGGIKYSINPQEHTVTVDYLLDTSCEKITIPGQIEVNGYAYPITGIKSDAFSGCSQLNTIIIEAITPPTLHGQNIFSLGVSIYVPCGTLEIYQNEWNSYAQQISYAPLIYPYNLAILPSEHGSVNHPTTICDENIVLTAVPDFGYHFIQWNDGNTENPRIIDLTQDTILVATFAVDITGTCGKDYALSWDYDSIGRRLTIQGNSAFDEHMECGVIKQNALEVVIGEGITDIGIQAFKECSIRTLWLPTSLKTIGDCAFYNCVDLTTIYNYRERPCQLEANSFEGVNKFDCTLYVPENSIEMYKSSGSNWRDFYYILPLESLESIDNVSLKTSILQKVLMDGQIFILRGDKTYTLTGQEVK